MTRGRMRAPRFALGMSRLAAGHPLTGTAFIPGLKDSVAQLPGSCGRPQRQVILTQDIIGFREVTPNWATES